MEKEKVFVLSRTMYDLMESMVEPSVFACYHSEEEALQEMLDLAFEESKESAHPETLEEIEERVLKTWNGYRLIVEDRSLEVGTIFSIEKTILV